MVDANQVWEVGQAIDWMKQLAEFNPMWIEEPTNPDDILGHQAIARALNRAGANVSFVEIPSDKGHDAFLLDEPDFHRTLAGFLAGCAVHAGLDG